MHSAHLCRNFRTIHGDYRNRAGIGLSHRPARARICISLLRSPGIDSQPGGQVRPPYLLYWPARIYRLAQATKAGGIVSFEYRKLSLLVADYRKVELVIGTHAILSLLAVTLGRCVLNCG